MGNTKRVTGMAVAMLACGLLLAGKASATSITLEFADTWDNFPGANVSSYFENLDEHGNPQIEKMSITFNQDTRRLEEVTIDMTNRLYWDTLFINTNWDAQYGTGSYAEWDFMVRDQSVAVNTTVAGYLPNLVDTNDGVGQAIYEVDATYDYTLVPGGIGGRLDHPNGIAESDLTDLYSSAGVSFITYASNILTYNFLHTSLPEIILGQGFAIAYAPYCANDVIGAKVPTPATMLLLGTGLAGLLGVTRRRWNA